MKENQPKKKGVMFAPEKEDNLCKEEKKIAKQKELLERIFENRLKSCQCLMLVGWENNKSLCEQIYSQAKKLIQDFKEMIEPKDPSKLIHFIEVLNPRLIKTLELQEKDLLSLN